MTLSTPLRTLLAACLILSCAACVMAVRSPSPAVRPAPPPARPAIQADIAVFYDDLSPYGAWRVVEPYGWVWTPYGVSAGWRPYSEGRWVYTDYGWTWVSDWDWGWAPFHYGRWTVDASYGWVWIPGAEWAPAWVAWRHGRGWAGWAPLPPQVRWRAGIGLDLGGVDIDVVIRPATWCFVEERRLLEPRLVSHIVVSTRNVTILHDTRHVTKYVSVDRRVVNRGIDVDSIRRVTRHPVPRYRIVDDRGAAHRSRARIEGRDLRIFRPTIGDAPPRRSPGKSAKADPPRRRGSSGKPGRATGPPDRIERPGAAEPPRGSRREAPAAGPRPAPGRPQAASDDSSSAAPGKSRARSVRSRPRPGGAGASAAGPRGKDAPAGEAKPSSAKRDESAAPSRGKGRRKGDKKGDDKKKDEKAKKNEDEKKKGE